MPCGPLVATVIIPVVGDFGSFEGVAPRSPLHRVNRRARIREHELRVSADFACDHYLWLLVQRNRDGTAILELLRQAPSVLAVHVPLSPGEPKHFALPEAGRQRKSVHLLLGSGKLLD